MLKMLIYLLCFILFWSCTRGSEPDYISSPKCKMNGVLGQCVPAHQCLTTKESYNEKQSLPICWNKTETYICCAIDNTTESSIATTPRKTDDCESITSVTAPEVGQKSWNKCLEYQEKIMRPCKDMVLVEGKFRESKCIRDTLSLILENGVLENEYPNMVLLGYGDDINSVTWLSQGVIISERYILTFASHTNHRQYGPVKYIRTGVVNISDPVDSSRLFTVKRIIKHPSYKTPKPYNDIALLELDNEIPLDLSALPACIDVGNLPSYTNAVVLGWDTTNRGQRILQRGHLLKASSSNICVKPGARNPYDETTQICYYNNDSYRYGNFFEHILQIEHIKCMFVVTGLSVRHFNDHPDRPFTRVSAFVPWIESIVWP